MIGTIIIIIIAIVVLLIVFCTGYVLGACLETEEIQQKLHCFECEIETPVKEKYGNLYCSNCGLIHLNDYQ